MRENTTKNSLVGPTSQRHCSQVKCQIAKLLSRVRGKCLWRNLYEGLPKMNAAGKKELLKRSPVQFLPSALNFCKAKKSRRPVEGTGRRVEKNRSSSELRTN